MVLSGLSSRAFISSIAAFILLTASLKIHAAIIITGKSMQAINPISPVKNFTTSDILLLSPVYFITRPISWRDDTGLGSAVGLASPFVCSTVLPSGVVKTFMTLWVIVARPRILSSVLKQMTSFTLIVEISCFFEMRIAPL